MLSKSEQFRLTETRSFAELISPTTLRKADLHQIDQDVPRSRSATEFTHELRNILIAYCNYSGQDYTQGMNMVAGALLSNLAQNNDPQLKGSEIV